MAFDPDAFLAAPSAPHAPAAGGFDPDAFLGATAPAPPPAETPGVVESAALGAAQGATFGFGDELYGAANFLLSGGRKGSYTEARDRARARIHAAEEAHPIVSTIGNVAGGFVIPGGLVKSGATLGAKALAGAGLGALGGLGSSEGKDIGEIGTDVAKGAAVGGVLFPVVSTVAEKVVRGAPERAVKRLVGDITDGATATQRDRLVGGIAKEAAEGAVAKVGGEALPLSGRRGVDSVLDLMAREPVLKRTLRSASDEPEKALRAVQDTLQAKGSRLGEIYRDVDEVAFGAKVSDVVGALRGVARQYGNPAEKALRNQIDDLAETVQTQWGGRSHVPLAEVNKTIQVLQKKGFAGSPVLNVSLTKEMQRDTANALKDVLHGRFEEIAKMASAAEQKIASGDVVGDYLPKLVEKTRNIGEVRGLNKDYSTLRNLEDVLEYRAQRAASPSTTLRARGNNLLDLGLVATGNIPAFAAKKAYELVGKQILRFGDDKLAQLVMQARAGKPQAEIAQRAIELGIGNAALAPLLARWAERAAEQSTGGPPS